MSSRRVQLYLQSLAPLLTQQPITPSPSPLLPEFSASQNFPLRKRGLPGRDAEPATTLRKLGCSEKRLRKETREELDARSILLSRPPPVVGPLARPLPAVGHSAAQPPSTTQRRPPPLPERRPPPSVAPSHIPGQRFSTAHTHTNTNTGQRRVSRIGIRAARAVKTEALEAKRVLIRALSRCATTPPPQTGH